MLRLTSQTREDLNALLIQVLDDRVDDVTALSRAIVWIQRIQQIEPEVESGPVVATIAVQDKTVWGYNAQFWFDSYEALSAAIEEHLGQFCFDTDDDVLVDAVRFAGNMLRKVKLDDETGEYVGELSSHRDPLEEIPLYEP